MWGESSDEQNRGVEALWWSSVTSPDIYSNNPSIPPAEISKADEPWVHFWKHVRCFVLREDFFASTTWSQIILILLIEFKSIIFFLLFLIRFHGPISIFMMTNQWWYFWVKMSSRAPLPVSAAGMWRTSAVVIISMFCMQVSHMT